MISRCALDNPPRLANPMNLDPNSTPHSPSPDSGAPQNRPMPAPKPPLVRPRRVRGGIKIDGSDAVGWAAQRWARLIEVAAGGEQLKEGLEYAQTGQTKRVTFASGHIDALVQGRATYAYTTQFRFQAFSAEQWDGIVSRLTEGGAYAAKLLSGEMPSNIEDAFVPLGLNLFPASAEDLDVSCTCSDYRDKSQAGGHGHWCKHVCCVAHIFGQKLSSEPFLMFQLRGVEGPELLDRIRQRRAVVSASSGATPVYGQRIAGVSDVPTRALEEEVARFWELGPEFQALDFPVEAPQLSHAVLRRLGPSPFQSAKFPLVGLLASCYETISQDALKIDLNDSEIAETG